MSEVAIERISKEMRREAATMGREEARHIVDAYYQLQEMRIANGNQLSAAGSQSEDSPSMEASIWLNEHIITLESRIRSILNTYASNQVPGAWAMLHKGIGPVIAAGLLAHIDIAKAPTAGHIWNFAGLNPGVEWGKGERRPWNARLKTLCWKIGESFVKVSSREDAYYGKLYRERKAYEIELNEGGKLAEQAHLQLERKSYSRETNAKAAYEQGKLPPAHIHARAKRWVVKLFLSHFHQVLFEDAYGTKAPVPYAIAHLGHAHLIEAPLWRGV